MFDLSRRRFLAGVSQVAATAALIKVPLRANARTLQQNETATEVAPVALDQGWSFYQGSLTIEDVSDSTNPTKWSPVTLPHCFNAEDACDPDRPYYRGQGWYTTRLKLRNPFPGGRTLLHFNGAGQTTTVWVGTKKVGTHKGGYDEFAFDITEACQELPGGIPAEGIPVAVCCDNAPDLERVPSDLSDFCLYGGLYRHVHLVYLPEVALSRVHILPALSSSGIANVSVKARLYNPDHRDSRCTLTLSVVSPAGDEVHVSRRVLPAWDGYAEIDAFEVAAPELWSPETPSLYRCRLNLTTASGSMDCEERFGVRRYEFAEHGPFLLNGKRVLLKGTQRHVDHARVAAGMTDDMVRQEMKLIREMGANFIRLAHYQQDRLVLDLCDELGLMVWEEVPWCRAGVGDEAFQRNAKDMLANMIDQHYNHPSVILWGLGNEDDWPGEYPSIDTRAIRAFMTELRDLAHQLDGSRLTSFRRCEFARDIPDVYSPSIWAGWYRGDYHEYEDSLLQHRKEVKRFIHIEWGADSMRGRHSEDPEAVLGKVNTHNGTDERGLDYLRSGGDERVSKDGDWSETYACNLFDWYLKTQQKLDWLTGSAQWVFKDFASPLRSDSVIPRINMKGVVERDLTLKESYFVFQSYWSQKPMAHIYGHTWPVRWGAAGQRRTVRVYSNCERVELFLNGKTLGSRKRNPEDFPAAGLRWDVTFAAGTNHLRAVAYAPGTQVEDQITFDYLTEQWGTPERLQLKEASRDGDRIRMEALLLDARDVPCLDAAHALRFSIAGAASMDDNLGTSRGSRVLQLSNGRASISVARKGAFTLTATAEGIPPAAISMS